MVTPAARREVVAQLRVAFAVSERRACSVVGVDRTSVRYRSRRPADAMLRARLRELAGIRRRFGYRRLHLLLKNEGLVMNHKKLRRLYREEGLQVRRRSGRKRALGTRAPMALPQGSNQRWSLDFVSDALADGRRFRILTMVDDFTRECLVLLPDTSLPGSRVARELDGVIAARGRPALCVSDNGTEFTSMAILGWAQERRIEWHYIAPGKPQQNGRLERLHLTLLQDAASPPAHSLRQQLERLRVFREVYNEERPHQALGNDTPAKHYAASPRCFDGILREPTYGPDDAIRRVRHNGEIRWQGNTIYISAALIGEPVGLIENEDGRWNVFYGPVALGIITHGGDRLRKPKRRARGLVDNEARCPQGPQAQQQQQQKQG